MWRCFRYSIYCLEQILKIKLTPMSQVNKQSIKAFLERPIAYHPVIAKAFGSINLAVLWCQLYYWTGKGRDPEWVYKTREGWFEEIGLSRYEQETARRIGRELGVIEEKKKGIPCTIHYRINMERTIEVVESYIKSEVLQTGWGKRRKPVGGKTADQTGESQPTIYTENTTEITPETTATQQGATHPSFSQIEKQINRAFSGGFDLPRQ